jgi:hypothetical protein
MTGENSGMIKIEQAASTSGTTPQLFDLGLGIRAPGRIK